MQATRLKCCKYQHKAVAWGVSECVWWGASDAFSLRVQVNGFPRVGVKPVPYWGFGLVNLSLSSHKPNYFELLNKGCVKSGGVLSWSRCKNLMVCQHAAWHQSWMWLWSSLLSSQGSAEAKEPWRKRTARVRK